MGPCESLSPQQIVQKIVSDAAAYNSSKRGPVYGFTDDPLNDPDPSRYFGFLARAAEYEIPAQIQIPVVPEIHSFTVNNSHI